MPATYAPTQFRAQYRRRIESIVTTKPSALHQRRSFLPRPFDVEDHRGDQFWAQYLRNQTGLGPRIFDRGSEMPAALIVCQNKPVVVRPHRAYFYG